MTSAVPVWVHKYDDQSNLQIFLRDSNIGSFIYSFALFTIYGYITNSQSHQLPDGLIDQLVEHCTGIVVVMGSNPCRPKFFQALISQLLKLGYNCDDQSCRLIYLCSSNIYFFIYSLA